MELENKLGRQFQEMSHMFKAAVRSVCEKEGIPSGYFHVLLFLGLNHDKVTIQSDIVEFLRFKPSTVSVTLSNMENENLIIRSKDEGDSRKTIIELTTKGEEYSKRIKDVFNKIESSLMNSINNEEYKIINEINKKLFSCLEGWVNKECLN